MKKTRIKKYISFIISLVLLLSLLGGCTQAESKPAVTQESEAETQSESLVAEAGVLQINENRVMDTPNEGDAFYGQDATYTASYVDYSRALDTTLNILLTAMD